MKSFARNRKNKRADDTVDQPTEALLDVDQLDIAPLGATPPAGSDPLADEAADFAERLGDLDRFIGGHGIGGGSEATVSWTPSPATRNLPIPVIPAAVAPISHPRPPAPPTAPTAGDVPVADPEAEAQDFIDRLGDLDRFIGGGAPAAAAAAPAPRPVTAPQPTAAAPQPTGEPEDEAQEFLDRLGDLDRFIGGHGIGGTGQDPSA